MRVAIILGGAENVWKEIDQARNLCIAAEVEPTFFAINDMIAQFAGPIIGITLHPDKLAAWLTWRRARGFQMPEKVWAHRLGGGVTNISVDWRGSSGLFATYIALKELKFQRVILCGVPMTVEDKHFVRHQRWNSATAFWRYWVMHKTELAPYVRSYSGQTAKMLGRPDIAFVREPATVIPAVVA